MTLKKFIKTLTNDAPDPNLDDLLAAMWWQSNDEWDRAHDLVQNHHGNDAQWVHAFLHRVQGDLCKSRYWYGCAGHDMPSKSIETEWKDITFALLDNIQ